MEEEQSDEDEEDSFDGDGQPRKKRARLTRSGLNEVEKQRTRRSNEQIQSLRALLEASGLNTKKDKFSILKKYVSGREGRRERWVPVCVCARYVGVVRNFALVVVCVHTTLFVHPSSVRSVLFSLFNSSRHL